MIKDLTVKVSQGAFYVLIQNAFSTFIGFIFYAVVPRYISYADIGVISLLTFIITLVPLLGTLALPSAAVKYISQFLGSGESEKAGSVASTTQRIVFLSSVVATTISFPILFFVTPVSLPVLVVTCLTAFLISISSSYYGFLQGLGQFGKFAVTMMLGSTALGRVISTLLVACGFGMLGVVIGWFLGGACGFSVGYVFYRGTLPISHQEFYVKTLFSFSVPLLLLNTSTFILNYSNRMLFLALTNDYTNLGIYELATRALAPAGLLSTPMSVTIFPTLSEILGKSREQFSRALSTSMRYLTMLILPLCVGLISISPDYLAWLFGWENGIGHVIFPILCGAFFLDAYVTIFLSSVSALGKTISLVKVCLISLVLNLLLMIILVPSMNVYGAALTRVVMSVTYALLILNELRNEVKVKLNVNTIARSLLATTIMGISLLVLRIYVLRNFHLVNMFISIPTGFSIYLLVLVILKEFRKEEFDLLRGIFSWLR